MEAYLGEIRMFAGDFAPQNWAKCDGAELQIQSYSALYTLIGTSYGGDGVRTFKLPDLRGRVPMGQGQGASQIYRIGQQGGTETVTLNEAGMPGHLHQAYAYADPAALPNATTDTPSPSALLARTDDTSPFYVKKEPPAGSVVQLDPASVSTSGGAGTAALAHNNVMPSFCVTFIICLAGIFPQRQ